VRGRTTIGVVLAASLFAVGACASGDSDEGRPTTADVPPPTTVPADKAPPEVVDHPNDWTLPNRDYANTRAVFDTPIDSSTVADLEIVWSYELPGGGMFGNAATTPLIVGDVVYAASLTTVVHAVDRESGEGLWTAGSPGSMWGPTGVAVGWGKVFGTKIGASERGKLIVAYDSDSGEELWATDITINGGEVNIQPSVYDGLVFAATSLGVAPGVRGTLWALDQETGDVVWSFDTIESEDLWGNPDVNSGGGAWYPPAVDTEHDVVYFGISNPWPMPGAPGFPNASSRPGDNKWTNSTLALDTSSGELLWGFQAFPQDLFDRDHVLASLTEVDGRRIVISTGKGGVVFGLDATTGDELWSVSVGEHLNDDVTEFDGPLRVMPGAQGGVLTPIAVAGEVVYVTAVNAPTTYEAPEASSFGLNTELRTRPGNVVAIDASDGEILWDVEIDGDPLGGATVVNDLVFTATLGGRIVALDRETGEEVWDMQADGGINGWPAVAGDLIVWPVGLGEPPHLMALRVG
jgi:outer membrane protein assembly factor BamB